MNKIFVYVSHRTANIGQCKELLDKLEKERKDLETQIIYIEDDIQRAINEGILATPTIDVSGTRIVGIPTLEEIMALLDR